MAAFSVRSAAGTALLAYGVANMLSNDASPFSWVVASTMVWSTFLVGASRQDVRQAWPIIFWAAASILAFVAFLKADSSFRGWSDIYYFCSSANKSVDYCTCDLSWNWNGYRKFAIIWNFVLTAALGVQKLVVTFLLDGLLPGEEMVTKESFMSVCWRLIPYWLNNWENNWGAECSSALFELPHFAVELLIVLPTVQILCSRLRIIVLPQLRVMPEAGRDVEDLPRDQLAPNIMRGFWEVDARQTSVWGRLRANNRVMLLMVAVALLAAGNALVVPPAMEAAVMAHPRSVELSSMPLGSGPLSERLMTMAGTLLHRKCPSQEAIHRGMQKHASELRKMSNPRHVHNLPLIEIALAIMRLSCEKFFVLASVYCAFLIFREPPLWVRHIISTIAKVSDAFQTIILMTFPALCWYYNAGKIFSTFVTIVLWTAPLIRFLEKLRLNITNVRPTSLTTSTPADIERMDRKCAICWSDFTADDHRDPPSPWAPQSLPCSHAFHRSCIVQWLRQCHSQGRNATCPMCSATVELSVQWRLPWSAREPDEGVGMPGEDGELQTEGEPRDNNPAAAGAAGLFPEIQAIIENMDDLGVAHAAAAAAAAGVGGDIAAEVIPEAFPQPPIAQPAAEQQQALQEQQREPPAEQYGFAGVQVARRWMGFLRRAPRPAEDNPERPHAASIVEAASQSGGTVSLGASRQHSLHTSSQPQIQPQPQHSVRSSGHSMRHDGSTDCDSGPSAFAERTAWSTLSDSATSADRSPRAAWHDGGMVPSSSRLRQHQQAKGQQRWQRQLSSGVSFGSDVSRASAASDAGRTAVTSDAALHPSSAAEVTQPASTHSKPFCGRSYQLGSASIGYDDATRVTPTRTEDDPVGGTVRRSIRQRLLAASCRRSNREDVPRRSE